MLAAALLLAVVGAIDDARHLSPAPKFAAQAVAVLLVLAALPEGMRVCPLLPWTLERAAMFIAGLWVVNLVNFMDGIDWMMVAEVVPVTGGVALVGALGALPPEGLVVALALNGAMLGFAPFNRPVARLFLGDMGSLPIGLLLFWLLLLVAGSGHLAAALLLPLYFVADATVTLARRARAASGYGRRTARTSTSARATTALAPGHHRPRLCGQLRARGAGGAERRVRVADGEPRDARPWCDARRMAACDLRAEAAVSERILVTGASGFVGRALVAALAQAGHEVRAATRRPGAAALPPGVEAVAVPDFRNPVDWAPLLAGVDAVVHLAGIAHVGLDLDPALYDRVIRDATTELAAACAKAGVRRLVFVSSVRAQCGASAPGVLREVDTPRPAEAYGRAKLAAEVAALAGATPCTVLRPVMVYGPGVAGNLATLMRIADTPWPLPFAAFDNRRSLVSLDNLIAAITFVLGSTATQNETYLVADTEPVYLRRDCHCASPWSLPSAAALPGAAGAVRDRAQSARQGGHVGTPRGLAGRRPRQADRRRLAAARRHQGWPSATRGGLTRGVIGPPAAQAHHRQRACRR